MLFVKVICTYNEILSEFNFYVRVRTYEKRVTGMQPLRAAYSANRAITS
jgi:hypothetical protein